MFCVVTDWVPKCKEWCGVTGEPGGESEQCLQQYTAIVDIFYPAYAEETREHFYLLPDCGVTSSITVCMIYISLLVIFFLLPTLPFLSFVPCFPPTL